MAPGAALLPHRYYLLRDCLVRGWNYPAGAQAPRHPWRDDPGGVDSSRARGHASLLSTHHALRPRRLRRSDAADRLAGVSKSRGVGSAVAAR